MSSEEYLLSLLSKKKCESYYQGIYINQRVCPFVKFDKDRLTVKYEGKELVYSDISVKQLFLWHIYLILIKIKKLVCSK